MKRKAARLFHSSRLGRCFRRCSNCSLLPFAEQLNIEMEAPLQLYRGILTPRVPVFRESEITLLHGHTSEVTQCEWTPNASLLASVSRDATARIWEFDPLSSQIRRIQILHHFNSKMNLEKKQVTALQWKDDGTLLATYSNDGQARIWSHDGELKSTPTKHKEGKGSVKWNKKCDYILSWNNEKKEAVVVWDLKAEECKQKFEFHEGPVLDADWLDNVSFATGSADTRIYVCKIGDNKPIKCFVGHTDEINSVRWDPTGSFLASGSDDHTVKIWKINQDNVVHDLEGHTEGVFAIRWCPTGDDPNKPLRLASASYDSIVKLWNVEQGQLLYNIVHSDVVCFAFSPDGDYLASGSQDSCVHIWLVKHGYILQKYKGTGGSVHGVCWSPKGDRLAAGLSNGVVCLLDFRK